MDNEEQKRPKDDVSILPPDYTLRKTIGYGVDLRQLFDAQVIEEAQRHVTEQQKSFLEWFGDDLQTLDVACGILERMPSERETQLTSLHLTAITIKSRAGTFGYDLASEIARSLYIFLDDFSFSEGQCLVIRKHIEALQVVLQHHITGTGGDKGKELLRDISRLTSKFRKPI